MYKYVISTRDRKESLFLLYKGEIYNNLSILSNDKSKTFLTKLGKLSGKHVPWEETISINVYIYSNNINVGDYCYCGDVPRYGFVIKNESFLEHYKKKGAYVILRQYKSPIYDQI